MLNTLIYKTSKLPKGYSAFGNLDSCLQNTFIEKHVKKQD